MSPRQLLQKRRGGVHLGTQRPGGAGPRFPLFFKITFAQANPNANCPPGTESLLPAWLPVPSLRAASPLSVLLETRSSCPTTVCRRHPCPNPPQLQYKLTATEYLLNTRILRHQNLFPETESLEKLNGLSRLLLSYLQRAGVYGLAPEACSDKPRWVYSVRERNEGYLLTVPW